MTNTVKKEKNRCRLPLPARTVLFFNLLLLALIKNDYERFERFYLIR